MTIIFTIQPHSIVDVITNSSSELFVFQGDEKQNIENIIREMRNSVATKIGCEPPTSDDIYKNYLIEYYPLKHIDELSIDEFDTYICYRYDTYIDYKKENVELIPGYTFEEMYENEVYGGCYKYRLKDDFVRNDFEKIKLAIDPEKKMFFLFSKDDNPDWSIQQQLESIAERYHLG